MPVSRLMTMRWVLTWKPSDEHPQGRMAKARIVVLGYHHPEVAELKMTSPTLSRLGIMLTLHWASFNHAQLECGDGKEMQDEDVYASALDKIVCAMNITLGSAVKLSNAVYGPGNAPRSWWHSVDRFLTSMGGRRTRTDSTVWCFSSERLGTTSALVAAAYMDDFIITRIAGKRFEQLKSGLRQRFHWGSWKLRSFGLSRFRLRKKKKWTT